MSTTTSTETTAVKSVTPPLNLMKWVEEYRHELQPPVGNKYLYSGDDFFVMVIGGPNARNDFHVTASEEFFYQVKGDIVVRIRENGGITDYTIREGETFFIPPNVPHSPQRGPNTVGMVVERVRPAGEIEHMVFYCGSCGELVYDKEFDCKDIVEHFRDAMEEFWANEKLSTCGKCGIRVEKPAPRS